MKKAEQGQRTRRELIRMGANLFALHGYHHTSTGEILDAASISKGAFYHHFVSKEDFALAVLDQILEDYQEQVIGPIETLPPGERLGAALGRIVELNSSARWCNCRLLARLIQEMGRAENDLARKVSETSEFLVNFLTGCLQAAIEAGSIKAELQPQATAKLILASLFGVLSCKDVESLQIPLDGFINRLSALLTATP